METLQKIEKLLEQRLDVTALVDKTDDGVLIVFSYAPSDKRTENEWRLFCKRVNDFSAADISARARGTRPPVYRILFRSDNPESVLLVLKEGLPKDSSAPTEGTWGFLPQYVFKVTKNFSTPTTSDSDAVEAKL